MLTYDLSKRGSRPLYDYLYTKIKEDILSKKLASHEKLPSKRQLAAHHKISVITVESAYNQLMIEGFIYSLEKRGYFVSELEDSCFMPKAKVPSTESESIKEDTFLLDISSGKTNPEIFPFSVWSKLLRQTLSEKYTSLLDPISHNGILELRLAISRHLYRYRGMIVKPEQVIIGSGTEYLYTLLIQLFGKDSFYAVENPGYKKFSKILNGFDAKWGFCDLTESGFDVNKLLDMRANIVHTSPTHHYPTGIVMSASKRRELLNWSYKKADRFIIEDDYDSEFRFSSRPLPPLFNMDEGNRVIYMNTFSKTIAPSMRISYMILPDSLLEKYNRELGFYSCTVPSFEQYTLYRFISEGYFEKHITRAKNFYKILRDKVIEAISDSAICEKITIDEKNAGLHFLLKIDTSLCDDELKKLLTNCGIKANLLSDYAYKNDPGFSSTIVFNYSAIDIKSLKNALAMLEDRLI